MSKHTAGPWSMSGSQPILITDASGREIAYVPVCMTDCDEPRAFADAALIIEAPNLLAALQGLLRAHCPRVVEAIEGGQCDSVAQTLLQSHVRRAVAVVSRLGGFKREDQKDNGRATGVASLESN